MLTFLQKSKSLLKRSTQNLKRSSTTLREDRRTIKPENKISCKYFMSQLAASWKKWYNPESSWAKLHEENRDRLPQAGLAQMQVHLSDQSKVLCSWKTVTDKIKGLWFLWMAREENILVLSKQHEAFTSKAARCSQLYYKLFTTVRSLVCRSICHMHKYDKRKTTGDSR